MLVFLWAVQVNINKMSNDIMLASLLVVEVNMATKCRVKSVGVSVGCSSEQEHKMSSNMNSVMFSLTKFSYTSSIIVRTVNLGIKKEVTK